MTVTVEMWKNVPMQVGFGVGDGELHLCREEINQERGVMFFGSASKTRRKQEVGISSEDRASINIVRVDAACGGNDSA